MPEADWDAFYASSSLIFLHFGDGDTGLAARMVSFSLLGIAISISVKGFRDRAIKQGRQEMFRPVTKRLPANPRLSLPDVRK